jgi:hypothetical protein
VFKCTTKAENGVCRVDTVEVQGAKERGGVTGRKAKGREGGENGGINDARSTQEESVDKASAWGREAGVGAGWGKGQHERGEERGGRGMGGAEGEGEMRQPAAWRS